MQNRRREFFNRHAENWDSNSSPSCKNLGRVMKEANLKKGSFVCDVGTGTGILIPYILKKIGNTGRIIAIDYSSAMIEKAKIKHRDKNVEFYVVDIHKTMFPYDYFDYVIANACFPHFEKKRIALKEIHRILKKNGMLVISHPTGRDAVNKLHKNADGCIKKDVLPKAATLAKLLQQCFFQPEKIIDEPGFYFVSAIKS